MSSVLPANKQQRKTAKTYSLITGTGNIKQISRSYQVYCKQTNERWFAKIIDNQQIKNYKMQQCIQFNVQALYNSQQMQNIIYVYQVFEKSSNTFIIQQIYDETLVEYVKQSRPVNPLKMEEILSQLVNGLFELYTSRYNTRSIRPQHIVCVDQVWKIQSIVLDTEIYPAKSQFSWDPRFASPQQRYKNGKIDRQKVDEQLVWQVGIIGLYMLYGEDYQYEKIYKDDDINWAQVKTLVSKEVFQMLKGALRVRYQDRIRMRDFLQLSIFNRIDKTHFLSFLQTQSKFFHAAKLPLKVSSKPPDQQIWNELKNAVERFKIFSQIDKFIQQLPFKNNFDISLVCYLSYRICYENLQKIVQQTEKWRGFDSVASSSQSLSTWLDKIQLLKNKVENSKIQYTKNIIKRKKSDISSVNQMLMELSQINDETLYTKIMKLYWKVSGYIYTTLSKQIDSKIGSKSNQSKQRTLCYYSLCAYLLHDFEIQDFKGIKQFEGQKVLYLSQYLHQATIEQLRDNTQAIVKNYFQTVPV